MKPGDVITQDCVQIVRPGYRLAPKYLDKFFGPVVDKEVSKNSALTKLQDVAPHEHKPQH